MNIAFVTASAWAALTPDDRLAADALRASGSEITPALWDDASVDWRSFDLVVIRSPWDYFRRPSEFGAWLERMERDGIPCWNPVPLLRWNSDKRYLRELAESGVPVVPTRFVSALSAASLAGIAAEEGWSELVVKPAISGGAFRTQRLRAGDALLPAEDDAGEPTTSWLVQPYLEEIARAGEWSLIYLDGVFSHAVRKRPASGEFRVQQHLGGVARAEQPPRHVVEAAEDVLARVRWPWLYARVDGVELDGRFTLVELEMLEPSLFLESDAEAPARFARAIRAVGARTRAGTGAVRGDARC